MLAQIVTMCQYQPVAPTLILTTDRADTGPVARYVINLENAYSYETSITNGY